MGLPVSSAPDALGGLTVRQRLLQPVPGAAEATERRGSRWHSAVSELPAGGAERWPGEGPLRLCAVFVLAKRAPSGCRPRQHERANSQGPLRHGRDQWEKGG